MTEKDKEINQIISKTKKIEMPVFNEKQAWLVVSEKTGNKNNVLVFTKKSLKYAAIVIIGLIIGFFISKLGNKEENKFVEIFVKKGQKIDINLPDGNKIWINSNSSIKYPANFEGIDKKIYFMGEAYFEFSENNLMPIFVVVNDLVIQGFNSSFNIKTFTENNGTEITVTKGWLTLNNPNTDINEKILEEGQIAYFNDDLPLFVSKNSNLNYLAWKTGKLHFNEIPLKTVAKTLSDFYEIPVEISGKVKYCNFSSDYENADLQKILNDIERALNPNINIQKNKVIINGDDC